MTEMWNTILQTANLMAGIGACASALATGFTVKEMRKQREAAQQPDIFVSDFILQGPFVNLKSCSAAQLSNPKVMLGVSNIGVGAAKRVQIALRCPNGIEVSSALNAALHKAGSHFSVDLNDKQLSVQHCSDIQTEYAVTSYGSITLNYLLPMGQCGEKIRVDSRLSLLAHFIACAVKTYDSPEIDRLLKQLRFPLDVRCQNIENRDLCFPLAMVFHGLLLEHDSQTYTIRFTVE